MCEYIAWVHGKERKYAMILLHGYIRSGEANYRWHCEGRDSGGQGVREWFIQAYWNKR